MIKTVFNPQMHVHLSINKHNEANMLINRSLMNQWRLICLVKIIQMTEELLNQKML